MVSLPGVGLYTGDQPPLDANLSATATVPDATASMGQHCDDVIAGVPDHSVPGRLPVHSPSHHVVRAEGTSASSLESAADSVVIEGHPGSSSSGLSLQLNLGLASEPPTRHGSERSGALSPFTPLWQAAPCRLCIAQESQR